MVGAVGAFEEPPDRAGIPDVIEDDLHLVQDVGRQGLQPAVGGEGVVLPQLARRKGHSAGSVRLVKPM